MTHRRNLLLLPLFLLLAVAPATAQGPSRNDRVDIEEELLPELAQFAVSFWVPKLNSYKVRIDRSLPASELATLDALRIKWGIEIEGETQAIDQSARVDREPEPEDLFESTQALATRNRVRMDAIRDIVVADINEFLDAGIEVIDRFYEKNIGRIEATDHSGMLQNWPEMRDEIQSPDGRAKLLREFGDFYGQGAEAFVMLYNGQDVFRLLGMALPASAPLPEMNMPQSSMLAQNAPNPAGISTRIGYTLTEPSSSTSIEIFAASGARVLTLEQGARPAGEHSVIVDLTKLSSGSYLYRLTVQTANAEQVSSRVMQVVR